MQRVDNPQSKNSLLMEYAGLAFQFLAGIAVGVFLGILADRKLSFGQPVFSWLLPLVIIVAMLIRIIRDTSKKQL